MPYIEKQLLVNSSNFFFLLHNHLKVCQISPAIAYVRLPTTKEIYGETVSNK